MKEFKTVVAGSDVTLKVLDALNPMKCHHYAAEKKTLRFHWCFRTYHISAE